MGHARAKGPDRVLRKVGWGRVFLECQGHASGRWGSPKKELAHSHSAHLWLSADPRRLGKRELTAVPKKNLGKEKPCWRPSGWLSKSPHVKLGKGPDVGGLPLRRARPFLFAAHCTKEKGNFSEKQMMRCAYGGQRRWWQCVESSAWSPGSVPRVGTPPARHRGGAWQASAPLNVAV